MGAKLKKVHGSWYLYVNHSGTRKCRKIGKDRKLAEAVRREVEAKLALGDIGFLSTARPGPTAPTFGDYADQWLRLYAGTQCKDSTVEGYEGTLRNYLRPRFSNRLLTGITREDVKSMIADLKTKGLARGTIKNALAVFRKIYNEAIEDGVIESNPAARLGKFTKGAKTAEKKGVALAPDEIEHFLEAVMEVCPEYYALFVTDFRAGLRRGEVVALQIGDLNFGANEDDANRYILVQHNYVRRKHTTTKSKKARRVDMSKDLRRLLMEQVEKRLLALHLQGKVEVTNELVFPGPNGGILDPDNLYHRYFRPALKKSGIRSIRLHDIRAFLI